MGATLATKRTTAERLAPGVDPNALVVEPYANPFRTYPLVEDYAKFKLLIDSGVECYILNTGDFMGKKVEPKHTLGIIESIVEAKAVFNPWGNFSDVEIMDLDDFKVDLNDAEYKKELKARLNDRVEYLKSREREKGGVDALPADAVSSIIKLFSEF